MAPLNQIIQETLKYYAGEAVNGHIYLTISPDEATYILTAIGSLQGRRFVNTVILLRIEHELIIIERDQTDKSVVDALVQAGIPRQQIVLAYAGESVPEPEPADVHP
jgi:hypothetical protein